MSREYLADVFTDPSALAAFKERIEQVHATRQNLCKLLGLTLGQVLPFGTAGLALCGIDGRIDDDPVYPEGLETDFTPVTPFDFDTVVPSATIADLWQRMRRYNPSFWWNNQDHSTFHFPASEQMLPVAFFPYLPVGEKSAWFYSKIDPLTLQVGEHRAIQPAKLALGKIISGRARDFPGIIKSNIVGHALGNRVVLAPDYALAVHAAQLHALAAPHTGYDWLEELKARNFNHPAFEHIPKVDPAMAAGYLATLRS